VDQGRFGGIRELKGGERGYGPSLAPKIHDPQTNRLFKTIVHCIWLQTQQLPDQTYRSAHSRTCAGTLQAIRIFASNPKWVPVARPCDDNPARVAYRQRLALLKHL